MTSSRDHVLHKVRTALGRSAGEPAPDPPPARLAIPRIDVETRIAGFFTAIQALTGRTLRAANEEQVREYASKLTAGKRSVASNASVLARFGITALPGVQSDFTGEAALRAACAAADVGITSVDYALADTGTLVLMSSAREARMISLLPLVHLAIVPAERIVTGLDELLSLVPDPGELSSSMVMITGPSRTADIEMMLVRGVHGPGEIHVVVV
jgi:L-lactate utilization protein LutC